MLNNIYLAQPLQSNGYANPKETFYLVKYQVYYF